MKQVGIMLSPEAEAHLKAAHEKRVLNEQYISAPLNLLFPLNEFFKERYPKLSFTRALNAGRGRIDDTFELSIRIEDYGALSVERRLNQDTQMAMHETCHFAEMEIDRALLPNFGLQNKVEVEQFKFKTFNAIHRELRVLAYQRNWGDEVVKDNPNVKYMKKNIGKTMLNPFNLPNPAPFAPVVPLIEQFGAEGAAKYIDNYFDQMCEEYTYSRLVKALDERYKLI